MKQIQSQKAAEASKILLVLASAVLVVAGMKAAADILVPVLLAFFIAAVSFPITNWLREHGLPRSLAVIVTVLVDFAFLAGVVVVGIILVSELQTKWSNKYQYITRDRITVLADSTSSLMDKWGIKEESSSSKEAEAFEPSNDGSVLSGGAPVAPAPTPNAPTNNESVQENTTPVITSQADGVDMLFNQLLKSLSVGTVWALGTDFLWKMISFLGTSFVVLLLTVFMLSEARMFGRRFNAICEAQGPNLQRMLSATKDIQRYLGIKTMISLMTGFLAAMLCWGMGLDLPLLWGILAFALNFIPAIGSIIAGIPPILLSLLLTGDWKQAVMVGLGYLLINGFLGNFLEPMLLGRRFGISTLVVVISVIFWGWIWGPVGMLLAVPLTMLLKVAMDNSSDFRWIAVAISKENKGFGMPDEKLIKEAVQTAAESKRKKLAQQDGHQEA